MSRRWKGTCGVRLPGSLPDDQQDGYPPLQPVKVVAAEVGHVVDRVVEIRRVAALPPSVPRRRVIVAGQPDCQGEHVGVLQGEVHRVVRAEAAARGDDVEWSTA